MNWTRIGFWILVVLSALFLMESLLPIRVFG